MKVLVCGDRNWTDREAIWWALYGFPKDTVIISGGCSGADTFADEIAQEFGLVSEIYLADWKGAGKAAGPLRNKTMLEVGEPDLVIAFHNDITNSKGTKDMAHRARVAGVPVIVIRSDKS